MIDFSALVYSVIQSLAGGQVYPGLADPAPADQTFLVYTHYLVPNTNLARRTAASGSHTQRAPIQNQRLQIDCYTPRSPTTRALADLVIAAMEAQSAYSSPATFDAITITDQVMEPDPDVKLHRVMLEFSVWYFDP